MTTPTPEALAPTQAVSVERYYIDCEFDGHGGPLISIAIVTDGDDSIHIEADVEARDPWVLANVVPLLDKHDAPDCTRVRSNDVGALIRAFLGNAQRPVIIADSPVDIGRFCTALSTGSEGQWVSADYPQMKFEVHNVECYPTTLPGAVQHNAWWDAMALRHRLSHAPAAKGAEREILGSTRIARSEYPEIVQAVRWSDEDNGTNHFEPGIGFVVDDFDGLTVPDRWVAHLPMIEQALASLDHTAPHPLDVDTIEWLARDGAQPSIYESAARCFVCGEHTPMAAMQRSSRELWIASRFLNEYFEGWEFKPGSGWEAAPASPSSAALGGDGVREALQLCHDTLHECTAVLTANDCAKVAAVMEKAREALSCQA